MAEQRCKALVIGSGAGGAPAAFALAQRWGSDVVLLDAGPHRRAADFNQVESNMVRQLYTQGGAQATEDGALVLLSSKGVGGSTVVNDGICYRPPPELYPRWRAAGVPIEDGELDPGVEEVLAAMRVETVPREMINRCNYLVALGAARLGWRVERVAHNSPGCVQCGFRHIGCAYDRKQSMNLSFVPRFTEAGGRLFPGVKADRLVREGAQWRVLTDKGDWLAEHVVLAAGVIETPALMLRSGMSSGAGFAPHIESYVWGEFDEPVDQHNGIPMSIAVLEHGDIYGATGPGYVIEGIGVQPQAFAAALPFTGQENADTLARYRYFSGAVALLRSVGRGTISLGPGGRPKVEFPLIEADTRRITQFYGHAAELFFAAGAKRVLLSHRQHRWVEGPGDGDIASLPIEPGRQHLYSAHLFGGAGRGLVTDGLGRVPGAADLWVLDASAFPEPLGVNPQITIAALALQGARRILGDT